MSKFFRELQHRQPQVSALCVLMSGVSMPREPSEESDSEGGQDEPEGEVIVAVAAPQLQQEIDWRPMLQRMEQAEGDGKW